MRAIENRMVVDSEWSDFEKYEDDLAEIEEDMKYSHADDCYEDYYLEQKGIL